MLLSILQCTEWPPQQVTPNVSCAEVEKPAVAEETHIEQMITLW